VATLFRRSAAGKTVWIGADGVRSAKPKRAICKFSVCFAILVSKTQNEAFDFQIFAQESKSLRLLAEFSVQTNKVLVHFENPA
jgi:hypothetical protein